MYIMGGDILPIVKYTITCVKTSIFYRNRKHCLDTAPVFETLEYLQIENTKNVRQMSSIFECYYAILGHV